MGNVKKSVSDAGPEQPFRCLDIRFIKQKQLETYIMANIAIVHFSPQHCPGMERGEQSAVLFPFPGCGPLKRRPHNWPPAPPEGAHNPPQKAGSSNPLHLCR